MSCAIRLQGVLPKLVVVVQACRFVSPLRGSPSFCGLPRADARGYLLNAPTGAVFGGSSIFNDLKDRFFAHALEAVPSFRAPPETVAGTKLTSADEFFTRSRGPRVNPTSKRPTSMIGQKLLDLGFAAADRVKHAAEAHVAFRGAVAFGWRQLEVEHGNKLGVFEI